MQNKIITGSRKFILLIIVLSLLVCSGCWDRREIKTMSIVAGFALDPADNKDQVLLTCQIIDTSQVSSPAQGGGGGQGKSPFINRSLTSSTVFEGIRRFTHTESRRLFFSHSHEIIFGEELAQNGIKAYLDFFLRDYELRNINWILVAEGKANEILNVETKQNTIPCLYIDKLMEVQSANSQNYPVEMAEFIKRIMSKSTSPVAPLIKIIEKDKEQELQVSGTAVFDRDLKMAGKLNLQETRGLLWVLGKVKTGIVVIKAPDHDSRISLEILNASSKIIPEFKEGIPQITVIIKENAVLGEAMCSENLISQEVWNTMEKSQEAVIRHEVMMALDQARELNTDIFGFGDHIYKKYPREWRELQPRWEDIFPTLQVNVIVETKLRRPSMTVKTLEVQK